MGLDVKPVKQWQDKQYQGRQCRYQHLANHLANNKNKPIMGLPERLLVRLGAMVFTPPPPPPPPETLAL